MLARTPDRADCITGVSRKQRQGEDPMQTAGKSKFAARMASHLGEQIDAACPITRTGGTARQLGGALGGVAGSAIASTGRSGGGDVQIGQFAWLGLGIFHFAMTKSSMMGKPT